MIEEWWRGGYGGSSVQCFGPCHLTSSSSAFTDVEQDMRVLVKVVFPFTVWCVHFPFTYSDSCTKIAVFHVEPSHLLLFAARQHSCPIHPWLPNACFYSIIPFQVSKLPYFFLLSANSCSSISYSAKSLLYQSPESTKSQFIFIFTLNTTCSNSFYWA